MLEDEYDWQEWAACLDFSNALFFGPDDEHEPENPAAKHAREEDAKRICAVCKVQAECLEFALTNNEKFGIWGGLTESERATLKRRRSRQRKY